MCTGCGSKVDSVSKVADAENAMDIRANADYSSLPEVITDEVVSNTYGIDFYSAKTIDVNKDLEASDFYDTIFVTHSNNTLMLNCIDQTIKYMDKANIDADTGYVELMANYTDNMYVLVSVIDDIRYTSVIAVTEDLEDGQAKFLVQKEKDLNAE